MKNPYDILGMPHDASYSELENKYYSLKQKYGEQRFRDGEEGNEGARKLNELEIAWAEIKATFEAPKEEQRLKINFESVEKLIKEGKLDEAQAILDAMENKDAKWHYFQSIIYYKRDWLSESRAQLVIAVQLEPGNTKYQESLRKLDKAMNIGSRPEDIGRDSRGSNPYNDGQYSRGPNQNYRTNDDYQARRNAADTCSDCLCTYLLCETCCTCSRCMIH